MINFNNKYFTFLVLLFLIFIGYQNVKQQHEAGVSNFNEKIYTGQSSKFNYKIDPSKPSSQQSFIDKTLLKIVKDRNPYITEQKDHSQKIVSNNVINQGDTVTLIYKTSKTQESEPDPIAIIVGSKQIDPQVEKVMISLKVGDVRILELNELNKERVMIEILAINSGGKK